MRTRRSTAAGCRSGARRSRARRSGRSTGSEPDWNQASHVQPPEGAPNVLLVLIDDAGFGNPSTFGGPIETPNYTRLAENGLRYNRFHVTALCSPTRAALLTGRNHHRVGFGMVGEFSGPFPGYNATIPHDCAPFPRILQENGYLTGAFGKWHLTPDNQQGFSGPFDRWPTRLGFDYFWGFLGGEAGQYDPLIAENQKIIGVPEAKDGEQYYFQDDLADKTIDWLHRIRSEKPKTPWFAYVATGCSHAPHHVPREWSDKYRGAFDKGWDVMREETFARQKALGVVPADAELPPRNDAFPTWDSLDETHKRLYARQMEVYAGYSENADWNIGRIIDAIDEMGELENTVVIWIWGDNGASMEGTLTGHVQRADDAERDPAHARAADRAPLQARRPRGLGRRAARARITRPGGPGPATPRSTGASRSPRISAARGTRWSCTGRAGSATPGAVRSHYTHVTDVGATVLDLAGIPMPDSIDGDRAAAVRRRHVRRLVLGRGRAGAAHAAVLRDPRQPRDVQGRLAARPAAAADPVGPRPGEAAHVRPGLESRRRARRALLPARRLHAVEERRGRPSRRRCRSSASSSGRRPSATTSCRCSAG